MSALCQKQTCIAAKTALPAVAVSSLRFLRRIDRLGRNPRRAFTRPVVLAFDACPVNNARACKSSSPDLIRPQESNLAIVRDLKPNPVFRQTPDYQCRNRAALFVSKLQSSRMMRVLNNSTMRSARATILSLFGSETCAPTKPADRRLG